jgi:hypothetical protein
MGSRPKAGPLPPQDKQEKYEDKHSCLERFSNPRSQYPRTKTHMATVICVTLNSLFERKSYVLHTQRTAGCCGNTTNSWVLRQHNDQLGVVPTQRSAGCSDNTTSSSVSCQHMDPLDAVPTQRAASALPTQGADGDSANTTSTWV